jgi:hypothetical protein
VLEGSNDMILMVRASTFLYICKGLGFMSRILMHELMNTGTLFSAADTLHSKGIKSNPNSPAIVFPITEHL